MVNEIALTDPMISGSLESPWWFVPTFYPKILGGRWGHMNVTSHFVNVDRVVVLLGGGGDTSTLHAVIKLVWAFLHSEVVGTLKPSSQLSSHPAFTPLQPALMPFYLVLASSCPCTLPLCPALAGETSAICSNHSYTLAPCSNVLPLHPALMPLHLGLWGCFNTTYCNQTCLKFLYSEVVGTKNLGFNCTHTLVPWVVRAVILSYCDQPCTLLPHTLRSNSLATNWLRVQKGTGQEVALGGYLRKASLDLFPWGSS